MSGTKTSLTDLGQSFEKLKALQEAERRKQAVISELRSAFMRQGYSPVMAQNMAEIKYKAIHHEKD